MAPPGLGSPGDLSPAVSCPQGPSCPCPAPGLQWDVTVEQPVVLGVGLLLCTAERGSPDSEWSGWAPGWGCSSE